MRAGHVLGILYKPLQGATCVIGNARAKCVLAKFGLAGGVRHTDGTRHIELTPDIESTRVDQTSGITEHARA